MTVVFDAEPLLGLAFDEPGAGTVQSRLDDVYDGETDGYTTTVNLAEFRYVATRRASLEQADNHIEILRQMGLATYGVDELWDVASELKAAHTISLGDAYAVGAAEQLATDTADGVTLLVGADDDFDAVEGNSGFQHTVERFRDEPA